MLTDAPEGKKHALKMFEFEDQGKLLVFCFLGNM